MKRKRGFFIALGSTVATLGILFLTLGKPHHCGEHHHCKHVHSVKHHHNK